MHAIALVERGYGVVGADLSPGMIGRAWDNATASGVAPSGTDTPGVAFEVASFGELSARVGDDFDALLCLGNSLPHVLTPEGLAAALSDFAACLRPGGLLLIQNRNFDALLADRQRWMEPQSHREGETNWLFLRFYDFEPAGLLTFNLVTLRQEGATNWKQQITSTRLWPQTQSELTAALTAADFEAITCLGDLQGALFDAHDSPNLVVTARRTMRA
jgi:SAM-dependent methyltransferase